MLTYLLAVMIFLASLALYLSAFFFPELHRKSDFYWSGLGLFYGLVLWVCAGRITGAVLLGQTASVALLLWFGTQTLILRRSLASPEDKTIISQNIASRLKRLLSPSTLWQKIKPAKTATQATEQAQETSASSTVAQAENVTTQPSEMTETEETASTATSSEETTVTPQPSQETPSNQQPQQQKQPNNSSEPQDQQ